MTNQYREMKERHQQEFNEFPIVYAFSDRQFEKAMETLGLSVEDTDKIYSIPGGGFIRKSDSKAFGEMIDRFDKEMQDAIDADQTGDGFIFDMFNYELANHEYCITYGTEDTLNALGLTLADIDKDERLLHGLKKAKRAQFTESEVL